MLSVLISMLALTVIILTVACLIVGVKGFVSGIKTKRIGVIMLSVIVFMVGLAASGYVGYYKVVDAKNSNSFEAVMMIDNNSKVVTIQNIDNFR